MFTPTPRRHLWLPLALLAAAACGGSSAESTRTGPTGPTTPTAVESDEPAQPDQPDPAPATAAPFSLTDSTGASHTLAALTAEGPAVLVFYRGHW